MAEPHAGAYTTVAIQEEPSQQQQQDAEDQHGTSWHIFSSALCGPALLATWFLVVCAVALASASPWSPTSSTPDGRLGHAGTVTVAATAGIAGRAVPGRCQVFHNRGVWTGNYTSWRLLGRGRRRELSDLMEFGLGGEEQEQEQEQGTTTAAGQRRRRQRPRHVLLAGDSTIAQLNSHLPLKTLHPGQKPITVKKANRCSLLEYYGLPRAERWQAPDHRWEGPVAYGLNNSFCTDCGGCNATLRTVTEKATNATWTYEYLPIEFARDREFPTAAGAATSQQAAGQYLAASQQPRRDVCVLSAGIHDVILNITAARFAENVLDYLDVMRPFCRRIIWLLPSASLNRGPQTHPALLDFRRVLRERCDRMGSNVLLFELWDMSLPRVLHKDNVHHVGIYYDLLGRLLLQPELFKDDDDSDDEEE